MLDHFSSVESDPLAEAAHGRHFSAQPLISANSTLIEFKTSIRPEIYKDEGYKFMAAAFEVYNDRGYGLAEEIYQECLEIELALRGISFRAKAELKCCYKGRELKKCYIPDLFVLDCLVVELKAVTELAPEHEAQLLNYMRIARQPVGYLVNFGHKGTLEWKRFILADFIVPAPHPLRTDLPRDGISVD